jgi:hypothetical protein
VYFIIGGACLIVGQLIGWWVGYGRGKRDALRDLDRVQVQARRGKSGNPQNQNQNKRPVKAGQGRNKKR